MSVEITHMQIEEFIDQDITVKDDYLLEELQLEVFIEVSVTVDSFINQTIIVEDSE